MMSPKTNRTEPRRVVVFMGATDCEG
jgi:hypothetical protein